MLEGLWLCANLLWSGSKLRTHAPCSASLEHSSLSSCLVSWLVEWSFQLSLTYSNLRIDIIMTMVHFLPGASWRLTLPTNFNTAPTFFITNVLHKNIITFSWFLSFTRKEIYLTKISLLQNRAVKVEFSSLWHEF